MKPKNNLPQVLAFAQVARGGKVSLKKVVTQHLAARRFAEAHLWRFAGFQLEDGGQRSAGKFPEERYGSGFSQIGILEAVARYDHPASRVILLRALPWIVDAQNNDGSWGGGSRKDVETLAVVRVLRSGGVPV